MEREQVYFVVPVERAQLDAGDHTDACPLCCLAGCTDAVDSVVISERERGQPAALGGLDYSLGREGAVRGGRVSVQVDERRPARIRAHRA